MQGYIMAEDSYFQTNITHKLVINDKSIRFKQQNDKKEVNEEAQGRFILVVSDALQFDVLHWNLIERVVDNKPQLYSFFEDIVQDGAAMEDTKRL